MAIVTGPLFSLTASGKLGDAIVYTKWRGILAVRSYVKPYNPETAGQLAVRESFSDAVTDFHELSGADVAAMRKAAENKPYTGFNLYISWVRTAVEAASTWVRIKDVSASDLTSSGATINGTPNQAGILKVFYGTTPGSWTGSVSEASSHDADVNHEIDITGLEASTTYWYQLVYPLAVAKEGKAGYYSFTTAS